MKIQDRIDAISHIHSAKAFFEALYANIENLVKPKDIESDAIEFFNHNIDTLVDKLNNAKDAINQSEETPTNNETKENTNG